MQIHPFNPEHQLQSIESRIVVALERISEAFRVLLWNEGKTYGLSPIQVQILIFLNYQSVDKRKVTYLAQEFNMTKPTISDAVKALDQKGLITKEYQQEDTRSYRIHLTPKGKEIANFTSLFARELFVPVHSLHSGDKENLLLSLLHIIHHLNRTGIITVQRMCLTCMHYKSNHKGIDHYCSLLQSELKNSDMRLDCPDHIAVK